MIKHPDILSGLVLAILGVAVFFGARQIDVVQLDQGLSAAFFPALCGGLLAFTGVGIAVKGVLAAPAPMPFVADRRVAAVAAIFVAYFFTFTYVDFRIGAWAVLLVAMYTLGARGAKELIFVPVLVSAGIYALFRYGLQIQVPTWT